MDQVYAVNIRKVNDIAFPSDSYELSTAQSILAQASLVAATASRVTTTATVNMSNHGYIVGDTVTLIGSAPFNGAVVVTAANQNSFNFTVANSGATSGDVIVTVVTLVVNEYRGGTATPVNYTVTQTLAALRLAAPAGLFYAGTVVNKEQFTSNLVAPALGDSYLFSTTKTVSIIRNIYPTLTFTDMDRALTVVTVTSASHGLQVGQYVTVDSSNNALDGTYAVATVPTANTFTYVTTTSGTVTDATGTGFLENTKVSLYKEGAENWTYYLNEYYALVSPTTSETFSSTTSTLTTAALTSATTTVSNASAYAGRTIIGATISAYSGTYATNGIPQLLGAAVTSEGVITFTIYNAHATNALNGTVTVNYTFSN